MQFASNKRRVFVATEVEQDDSTRKLSANMQASRKHSAACKALLAELKAANILLADTGEYASTLEHTTLRLAYDEADKVHQKLIGRGAPTERDIADVEAARETLMQHENALMDAITEANRATPTPHDHAVPQGGEFGEDVEGNPPSSRDLESTFGAGSNAQEKEAVYHAVEMAKAKDKRRASGQKADKGKAKATASQASSARGSPTPSTNSDGYQVVGSGAESQAGSDSSGGTAFPSFSSIETPSSGMSFGSLTPPPASEPRSGPFAKSSALKQFAGLGPIQAGSARVSPSAPPSRLRNQVSDPSRSPGQWSEDRSQTDEEEPAVDPDAAARQGAMSLQPEAPEPTVVGAERATMAEYIPQYSTATPESPAEIQETLNKERVSTATAQAIARYTHNYFVSMIAVPGVNLWDKIKSLIQQGGTKSAPNESECSGCVALRAELDLVRAELKADMADLVTDLDRVENEVKPAMLEARNVLQRLETAGAVPPALAPTVAAAAQAVNAASTSRRSRIPAPAQPAASSSASAIKSRLQRLT